MENYVGEYSEFGFLPRNGGWNFIREWKDCWSENFAWSGNQVKDCCVDKRNFFEWFDSYRRQTIRRWSTEAQDFENQRELLRLAGCSRIFAEKISGARRQRPELERLLDHLRAGDLVVVTRLDRLARSTRDLLEVAERIQDVGAGLKSLAEPWADTTTPAGRMVMTVFAGIAEFERSLIIERTRTGRDAAKARGVKFGRPSALTDEQLALARELQGSKSMAEIARVLGVHRSTLYRALEPSDG